MPNYDNHAIHAWQVGLLLRILALVLILLATMVLGIGERSAWLTFVSLAVAGASVYFNDLTGMIRLRQRTANLAALAVMAGSAVYASFHDRHGQMLAVADMQSYLEYVLLFQPRTPRVYWQLALLSLGQVAIASTLVPGPMFGAVLLAYLLVGTILFVLLLLDRGSSCYDLAQVRTLRPPRGTTGTAADARSAGVPVLTGNSAALDLRSIVWGLLQQALLMGATTLVATAGLFFLLPRWNIPNQQADNVEPVRSVGFSTTVTLGALGEAVRNPDVVMRIQFFQRRSSRPFKLIGEPLFRGTVVTHYEGGRWTQPAPMMPKAVSTDVKTPYVRQKITAEPLDVPELFSIFPVFTLQPDEKLHVDANTDRLVRQEDTRAAQTEFEIATTGILNRTQRRIIPCDKPLGAGAVRELLQMPESSASAARRDPFAGLRATAERVLSGASVRAEDRMAAALALNDYLRNSGGYFYSLDAQARDPALDPLEDFVTTHRQGHCEYFAGALAMMLRSVGIPARLALGFKGGQWNSLGNYYQVQQLHAHAWVEVFLAEDEIPDVELDADGTKPPAAWLTLDPTEGTREADAGDGDRRLLTRAGQYADYALVLWNNYVFGMNSNRQRQGIYEPLAQAVNAASENLFSPQVWQARVRWLTGSHLDSFWQWYRRHWFSGWGGLVAAGFSLALAALYQAGRRLARLLRRLGFFASRSSDERQVLEMYRRLEAALDQRGLRRRPAQTAYEFAVEAGGDLSESLEYRRVAHLPRKIVEAFYRVRFGNRTLDNREADAVEHALVELELALGRLR